jgi:hypothetical protein
MILVLGIDLIVAHPALGLPSAHSVPGSKDHRPAGSDTVTSNPTDLDRTVPERTVPERTGTEQQRVADGLRSLATTLASTAGQVNEPPTAVDLAHQAATAAHGLAEWLDQQDPSTLTEELSAFALRHPETFVAISLGAGLAHGPKDAQWTGLPLAEAAPAFDSPVPTSVETAETVDNSPYAGDTAYVDDPAVVDPPLPPPTLLPVEDPR